MKKNFVLIVLFLLFVISGFSQKYIAKNGHIWFYSHTPMEDIEAHNHQVVSILDISTGDIVFNLLMKSFEFQRTLMQEHFNENYVESDKFPKAMFKGKITNLSQIDFKKDGEYKAHVEGDITIHGVTKKLSVDGTFTVKGGEVTAKSDFTIAPKDFDIKIPSLVENKIGKEMETHVDITYSANN